MIVISKAILHIMDFNSGATIYSGAELDMGAPGTYDFLAGHIDKLFKDASAKTVSSCLRAFSVKRHQIIWMSISLSLISAPASARIWIPALQMLVRQI